MTKKEISYICKAITPVSKWKQLKGSGVSAIPRGGATVAFDGLNKMLKQKGVFLVPVGELESFVPEVGRHGPEWTNSVLEQYPDLNDDVYKKIKEFVESLDI